MPDIRIATFGSNPIKSGARTVAPNIATTCCRPSAIVCGQGRRSSGAITPSVFCVHCGNQVAAIDVSPVLFCAATLARGPRCWMARESTRAGGAAVLAVRRGLDEDRCGAAAELRGKLAGKSAHDAVDREL